MYGEESQICKEAVKVFGKEQQTMMFIEECGELFQAISKHRRGFGSKDNIIEEIADVEIMLEQLKYVYKCHREVNQMKNKKIIRLCSRLEEHTKKRKSI